MELPLSGAKFQEAALLLRIRAHHRPLPAAAGKGGILMSHSDFDLVLSVFTWACAFMAISFLIDIFYMIQRRRKK